MKHEPTPTLSRVRRVWPAYGILGVILLLTLVAARNVALVRREKEKAEFERAVDQTREQFQRVINGNLILLDGLRGLANAKLAMGKPQFYAYVEALQLPKNYPGAQGLGFAYRVLQDHKDTEIERIRQKGVPAFHIWPESPRPQLCPVIFLAPSDALNDADIGFDLYSEPLRRATLERAATTGRSTASEKLNFAPSSKDQESAGLLLVTPMYWSGQSPPAPEVRATQLMGFFFSSIRLEELFKVFSQVRTNPDLAFQIYGGPVDAEHRLYDSIPQLPRGETNSLAAMATLAVADRTWTVYFFRPPALTIASSRSLDPATAAGGSVIGFLVFGMMLAQARARATAEEHAELQRSTEARFRRLVEQSIVGIYVIQNGRFVYVNPKMLEIFGCSREEELTSPLHMEFVAEESRTLTKENIEKRLRGDVDSIHFELRGRRRDGTVIDLEAHGGRVEYNGQPAILGSLVDITERRQAEKKLQAQLSRLDLLSRTTRAIGERQDLRSIFHVVLSSLEEHLAVDFSCVCLYDSAEEMLTVECVGVRSVALAREMDLVEQADIAIDQNGLSRCVRGQLVFEPDLATIDFPFPQRLRRGGMRSLVAAPLLVESKVFGVLIVARRQAKSFSSGECEFLRQLSEHVALAAHQAQLYAALRQAYDDLRQTQETVMQQERLRALGQLAGGIAHDINNAISPVILYTDSLLETEPDLSARTRECLETIQQSIHDVAETVSRMREFSRPREAQLTMVPVRLNHLVPQVVDLTRARWSDLPQERGIVIRMATDLAAELPAVTGIESEIREALINLIFNAVDAMPAGGTLTLRTGVPLGPSGGGDLARRAYIEVTDTGAGMDEDTRSRCLEPFFTTKGERGTGLGLAMVYGTIQRHGGEIQIESVIGHGTTMRLSFPVPTTAAAAEAARPAATIPAPSHLHILAIDDDPLVLESLRHILEIEGHAVVTADGGGQGLDAFRQAHDGGRPFDLVITDLGMPHVDGRQVASGVKSVSATTPVILHTGWGQRLIADGDIPPHVDYVLSKPPKLRELREALARCCRPPGA